MLFAIRDDDTAYFTKPAELEEAYSFVKSGCVSLSVVPMTVPRHKDNVFPYGKDIVYKEYDIRKNKELVDYLRNKVREGRYEILLHGYSHEYKKIGNEWLPEMLWKTKSQIINELEFGKKELEELFDCYISCFVAPNNGIDCRGIDACERLEMNYSGIIQHFDRHISYRYLKNYIYRWTYRVIKGVAPGKCFDYSKHKEIYAYAPDSYERLILEFEECKKHDWPFVIYTHYWNLLQDESEKRLLTDVYNYVISHGGELVSLSKCFK